MSIVGEKLFLYFWSLILYLGPLKTFFSAIFPVLWVKIYYFRIGPSVICNAGRGGGQLKC